MIIPEEEYKGAVTVLNNYRRNRRKIELLKDNYYNTVESPNLDGLPRGNGVSDKVSSAVIKLHNDPAYLRAKAEIDCVELALLRCDTECKTIFDDYYYKQGQGKAKSRGLISDIAARHTGRSPTVTEDENTRQKVPGIRWLNRRKILKNNEIQHD